MIVDDEDIEPGAMLILANDGGVGRVFFRREDALFARHPGCVAPAAQPVASLLVDGGPVPWWVACGWRCMKCHTLFYVSTRSQLRHAPCFEVRDDDRS